MEILYTIFIFPIETVMQIILDFIATYTGYGIGIIALSIIVNTAILPLYSFAEKTQDKERNIQYKIYPALLEIKQKFRGEKQFYAMKELYEKHNYHPIKSMRSILGFAIQVPFFIGAYIMLSNHTGLNDVLFLNFINLGQPDKLLFGINILPFIMTIANLLSVFNYSAVQTTAEKKQLIAMAILFLVLLYNAPSALVLYWTTSNLFSYVKNTYFGNNNN